MRFPACALALLFTLSGPPAGNLWKAFQNHVHLTDSELSSLDAGNAISKNPPSQNAREVDVFGMIRVETAADTLAVRFRNIAEFKKTDQVLEIGRFGSSPTVADLKDLTLDADDITAISSCEVGSCNMKLSSAMITRLRGDTKKTPPEQLFREILAEYVRTYLASGNGALVEYRDKPAAVSLGSEFQDMLSTATYLRDYSPEFYAYLQNYPRGKPAGVEDFIYWSKEKFGLKPVISVTHSFIYQRPGTSDVLIISKQIYASHYFDASVGMAGSIAGVPAGSRPYSYVFYFNRSRIDALGGMLGGVANSLIRQQLKDGMVTNLKLARQRLETR